MEEQKRKHPAHLVAIFISLGYFFGNIPFVQKNFELVILAIIFISFIQPVLEFFKARKESKETKAVEKVA